MPQWPTIYVMLPPASPGYPGGLVELVYGCISEVDWDVDDGLLQV